MEYTAQNIEYAVSVFYNSAQTESAQAHQWLTAAQRCPEAWSFVWELLQHTKGTEVQFFAATTLHTKLLRCWHELPLESYEELKDKLLQTVLAYSNGPKIVLNRLCISLAAFILQQGTGDLAATLRPLLSAENTSLLLEVLTVIPEEFYSMTMGTALRSKNRAALQQACPAVLDDMLRYLKMGHGKDVPSDETMQTWSSAASCAGSWLALGVDDLTADRPAVSLHDRLPICHTLLNIVHVIHANHDAVSDVALEACEAALNAVRAAGTAPDAVNYPDAALQLLTEFSALALNIMSKDNVMNSINDELLSTLTLCAVSLAECHSRCLVQGMSSNVAHSGLQSARSGAGQFLELLLACQAAPGHYPLHENRSQLVFGFWYTLQDEVLCLSENTDEVNPIWKELFTRLLTTLIQKSETPPESAMTKEDAEQFRCYRQDIADTIMYCYGVLGASCWSVALDAWRAGAREAALHACVSLADAAPPAHAPHAALLLARAVEVAADENAAHALTCTALDCLGAYASWLNTMITSNEEEGKHLAQSAIRAAGSALPRATPAAALALKKLSSECSQLAAPLATEIVNAAQSSAGRSSPWVRRQLLCAAGRALAAAPHRLSRPLLAALALQIKEEMMDQGTNPTKGTSGAEAAAALLSSLFNDDELSTEMFTTILPALSPYCEHEKLVPFLFLVLKQAISVLMDEFVPLLDEAGRLTVRGFDVHPCAEGLEVAKLIVVVFGKNWAGAGAILERAVSRTATAVAGDSAVRQDLADPLFSTLRTLTKKNPQLLGYIQHLLPQLVQLACECVRVWENNAARWACGWLSTLATDRPADLEHTAPALTAAALSCIGGVTPRNQLEPLSELLLGLNRGAWTTGGLPSWLRDALAHENFPTQHATPAHKDKFIAAVIREKNSKRRLMDSVQEFSLVCRGLVGTEYARQTIAAKQLVA